MKPPMNGARKGPQKTVTENTVIANPRVRLSNMSEKTAPTHYNHHQSATNYPWHKKKKTNSP
jgi:hypothetical protein